MESQNVGHSAKLLQAQNHIWNHLFSHMKFMPLKCIVDLGIPDIIHNYGQPMPLSQLIASLPIHPSKIHHIYRLMRIMTHYGFFSRQNVTENELEVKYMLSDISMLLLKNHPLSITPFLYLALDPVMINPGHQLSTWLKNDDTTSFETTYGKYIWDYAKFEPKFGNIFNDAMASDTQLVTSVLIEKCKGVFDGLESLVDVGGGTGTLAKAIAKSFPQLECIVFDVPHVVAGLQGKENLKYVGGDMFKEIPPADAILLKWILHDWNDEECLNILRNCKKAIMSKGKKGKLIIIEIVMETGMGDDDLVETKLLLDMIMMATSSGYERTKKEWDKLISSAGFSDYKIFPIVGLRSVIEIYP